MSAGKFRSPVPAGLPRWFRPAGSGSLPLGMRDGPFEPSAWTWRPASCFTTWRSSGGRIREASTPRTAMRLPPPCWKGNGCSSTTAPTARPRFRPTGRYCGATGSSTSMDTDREAPRCSSKTCSSSPATGPTFSTWPRWTRKTVKSAGRASARDTWPIPPP